MPTSAFPQFAFCNTLAAVSKRVRKLRDGLYHNGCVAPAGATLSGNPCSHRYSYKGSNC